MNGTITQDEVDARLTVNEKVEAARQRELRDDMLDNHEISKLIKEYRTAYPETPICNYMALYYSITGMNLD